MEIYARRSFISVSNYTCLLEYSETVSSRPPELKQSRWEVIKITSVDRISVIDDLQNKLFVASVTRICIYRSARRRLYLYNSLEFAEYCLSLWQRFLSIYVNVHLPWINLRLNCPVFYVPFHVFWYVPHRLAFLERLYCALPVYYFYIFMAVNCDLLSMYELLLLHCLLHVRDRCRLCILIAGLCCY